MNYKQRAAEHLRELIDNEGINQRILAERVGITSQAVNRIIHGVDSVSVRTAVKVNGEFPAYSVAWVMGLTELKQEPLQTPLQCNEKFEDARACQFCGRRGTAMLRRMQVDAEDMRCFVECSMCHGRTGAYRSDSAARNAWEGMA